MFRSLFSRMFGPWLQPPIHVDPPNLRQVSLHLIQPSSSLCFPAPYTELGNAVEHLLSGARIRHHHDMHQPWYPASLRYHQDARFAAQLSKLVDHPSPPRSMLEHTAKDGPEDVSLKHAQSVSILRSNGPRLMSIENQRANQCAIYLTFRTSSKSSRSQQSLSP